MENHNITDQNRNNTENQNIPEDYKYTYKTVIPIVVVNFVYLGSMLYAKKITWEGFAYDGIAQVICLVVSIWSTKVAICMEKVYHAWFLFWATKGKNYIEITYNGMLLLSLVGLILFILFHEDQLKKRRLAMLSLQTDSTLNSTTAEYGSTSQVENVDP